MRIPGFLARRRTTAEVGLTGFILSSKLRRPSRYSFNMRKTVLLCAGLVHLASSVAWSDTVTLQPAADTTLFENFPNNNFGSSDLASGTVGGNAGKLRTRALVRFELSGKVPMNATITSVDLTFRVTRVPPSPVPSTFGVHRIAGSWGEGNQTGKIGGQAATGDATWNARFFPGTSWTAPGAAASSDYVTKSSATRLVAGLGNYTFASTADLVADVQAWLTSPADNFGWIVISQSESTAFTARRFASREDPNNAPTLVINFTAPAAATPPTITTQPQNQTVAAGGSATFTVAATGTEPLSYQWKFNGTDIAGATSPSLTLANVQSSNAGNYTVAVSNAGGSITSTAAVLTVLSAPTITQQPQSQTVNAGATATFSVTANGSEPLIYQWKFNGSDIVGATGPTLNLPNVQPANAGSYLVIVANTAGSVTSSAVQLTVNQPTRSVSVTDAAIIEGNAGMTSAVFSITLSGPSAQTVTVDFATADGTATAGNDYLSLSGRLIFSPGETNKAVTVQVSGDTVNESDETFFVRLSGASNATIARNQGQGTIIDDDPPPAMSINDVSVSEGNSGTTNAVFTVSLSGTSGKGVSIDFTTSSGTATLGNDFASVSGTLTFSPGETSKTIAVPIVGDIAIESDESFSLNLTNPANATIARGQATGTILTDDFPISITTQPLSQTVSFAGTATFTVSAVGTGTLFYRWKFNGNDISNATNSTLALPNVQPANAGSYSVVVSDAAGSLTSASATLTVLSAPAITQQPQSQSVNAGANVTFSVTASGSVPLSYQWKFNGSDIAGATGATLSLPNVQSASAGDYTVVVSNSAGSVTSASAALTVLIAPAITQQPQSQTVTAGTDVIFSVIAEGSAPLRYQWKFNGNDIVTLSATTRTLTLINVQSLQAGDYTVVVTNSAGSITSAMATLTVLSAPVITQSPEPQIVNSGADVTFNVAATGSTLFSYQWKFNGGDILGATNASLTLTNVQAGQAGRYSVAVSNPAGTAFSSDAVLTVNAAVDVPPAFDRIELDGRAINIQFTVQPTYQLALEFTESLALPNWTSLTNVSAKLAPLKIVVPDSTSAGPQRFYRLKVTGRVR